MISNQAQIINGREIAKQMRANLANKLLILKDKFRIIPGLAVVLVGNDPASEIYVRNKIRFAQEVHLNSFEYKLPADIPLKHLIAKIDHLNNDPKVHAILIQLPLPAHLNKYEVINAINPDKDADGFHAANLGKLVTGQEGLIACTPQACMHILKSVVDDLAGKKVVIIGRSFIVGKPLAHLLLNENCTVTVTHSKTQNLPAETRQADILIAAAGSPGLVKKDWVKPGAIVIDVGISRIINDDQTSRLVGDVDFEAVKEVASHITPVPGGVGPVTIACLLENTAKAACKARGIDFEF